MRAKTAAAKKPAPMPTLRVAEDEAAEVEEADAEEVAEPVAEPEADELEEAVAFPSAIC